MARKSSTRRWFLLNSATRSFNFTANDQSKMRYPNELPRWYILTNWLARVAYGAKYYVGTSKVRAVYFLKRKEEMKKIHHNTYKKNRTKIKKQTLKLSPLYHIKRLSLGCHFIYNSLTILYGVHREYTAMALLHTRCIRRERLSSAPITSSFL